MKTTGKNIKRSNFSFKINVTLTMNPDKEKKQKNNIKAAVIVVGSLAFFILSFSLINYYVSREKVYSTPSYSWTNSPLANLLVWFPESIEIPVNCIIPLGTVS